MSDLTIENNILIRCNNKDIKEVIIPDNVTSIGDDAFSYLF